MSRPNAVLFDWDNTLVDSALCIFQAVNATLAAMGQRTWDHAEARERIARSLRDSFPDLFGDRWQEAKRIYYEAFESTHLEMLKPLPGAADILGRLHAAGVPLAVISNKTGRFIRKEVEFLGWDTYFIYLNGAGDSAADKPAAAPVEDALRAIGVAADHNVWFIGDAPVDMECAVNAGVQPVLVRHDSWRDGEFDRHPPARHFQSWSAFALYLDEILVP
jgi:phosphoglycolate phosphatase